MVSHPFYITEKADGSSTTAYRYRGEFGICNRNYDLERDEKNGYWSIAKLYEVEERLPEGVAIQWETIGPGINNNTMEVPTLQGRLFSAYNIEEKRYFTYPELVELANKIRFPMVPVVDSGSCFSVIGLEALGEGKYDNGHEREGVVVRSQYNLWGNKPASFKVLNLSYDH